MVCGPFPGHTSSVVPALSGGLLPPAAVPEPGLASPRPAFAFLESTA